MGTMLGNALGSNLGNGNRVLINFADGATASSIVNTQRLGMLWSFTQLMLWPEVGG